MTLASLEMSIEASDGVVLKGTLVYPADYAGASFPLVILASTGLDEPRVPSLKGIMGAKKKPLDVMSVTLPAAARLTWETPYVPPKTTSGIIVQDVPASEAAQQLVAWLQEQKLI